MIEEKYYMHKYSSGVDTWDGWMDQKLPGEDQDENSEKDEDVLIEVIESDEINKDAIKCIDSKYWVEAN